MSKGFPLHLLLGGTIGQKVFTHTRTTQKEAVLILTDRRDDALLAFDAYAHLVDTLGKADFIYEVVSSLQIATHYVFA